MRERRCLYSVLLKVVSIRFVCLLVGNSRKTRKGQYRGDELPTQEERDPVALKWMFTKTTNGQTSQQMKEIPGKSR